MSIDPEAILLARELSLAYGKSSVLSGVELTVRRGEFWAFVGPNGEGKTTLLRAILGALRPRSGTLELAPRVRDGWKVGFVPQRCDLRKTLPMTVADFVHLGLGGRRRVSRAGARESVRWALGTVGLGDLAWSDYWSISGGQRQRALVARGLVGRPELLLLDEPTNGLDLAAEHALLELIAGLNRETRITVVLVTHAIALAARYATHVALFHAGRVTSGLAGEVLSGPHLRRAYGIDMEVVRAFESLPLVRIHARANAP